MRGRLKAVLGFLGVVSAGVVSAETPVGYLPKLPAVSAVTAPQVAGDEGSGTWADESVLVDSLLGVVLVRTQKEVKDAGLRGADGLSVGEGLAVPGEVALGQRLGVFFG